jgi:hypothetical protein
VRRSLAKLPKHGFHLQNLQKNRCYFSERNGGLQSAAMVDLAWNSLGFDPQMKTSPA